MDFLWKWRLKAFCWTMIDSQLSSKRSDISENQECFDAGVFCSTVIYGWLNKTLIWLNKEFLSYMLDRLEVLLSQFSSYLILFYRASDLNPSLPEAVRYLPWWGQMWRLLELLERRGFPLPVQPWTRLRQGIPCVHVGWPGPRMQERGYVTFEHVNSNTIFIAPLLICGRAAVDLWSMISMNDS